MILLLARHQPKIQWPCTEYAGFDGLTGKNCIIRTAGPGKICGVAVPSPVNAGKTGQPIDIGAFRNENAT
jgi:hypothetical protein